MLFVLHIMIDDMMHGHHTVYAMLVCFVCLFFSDYGFSFFADSFLDTYFVSLSLSLLMHTNEIIKFQLGLYASASACACAFIRSLNANDGNDINLIIIA